MTTTARNASQMRLMTHARRWSVMLLSTLALALTACAGVGSPELGAESSPIEDASYDIAPDRTHATIEAAALHAFSVASTETNTSNVDRMRVGSIVQLESGAYVWLDPETSVSSSRPVIRLRVSVDHAATYIIHPDYSTRTAARISERITGYERHLVDAVDPLHRPVIVRTPSGRLLKYSHSEGTTDLGSARDLERITVARR